MDSRHEPRDPEGARQEDDAARLSEQAAEHVGRGYDSTQDAFVREQREQGKAEDDEDVSPR
ncbi:hypothetical protein NE235_34180 [Actinoallomurus spadix]|uniref:Uncharacterized protein n=1 Tax=Actinoallomurus spadix TaxID=79912 RepID=A0ABP3FC80_9ACTN|nr:hypothetical protein [Actinoallomurus spadix]MCO5991172.1 hypothetical protein [Actinoallomurus spadix]